MSDVCITITDPIYINTVAGTPNTDILLEVQEPYYIGVIGAEVVITEVDPVFAGWLNTVGFVTESEGKYLRDDQTLQYIEPPAGGYANNLYYSETASDITDYETLTYTPSLSQTEHTHTVKSSEGNKLLHNYIYPTGVAVESFPAGLWSFNFYGRVSSTSGVTKLGVTYFKRSILGVETDLFTAWSNEINNITDQWIKWDVTNPSFVVTSTDRMGARVLAQTTHNNNITISYAVGDGYGSYLNNPNRIRHSQLRDLNGDSNYQHITTAEKGLIGTATQITFGDKSSATDAGLLKSVSLGDDYVYFCVVEGTAGNAVWKKVPLFKAN